MKRIFFVIIFLAGMATAADDPEPRFEHLRIERHREHDTTFEMWYDKATGNEIICGYGNLSAASCFLSGRNWK